MLSATVVILTVASLVRLATNGNVNPYFACTTNSYSVLPNESDEIILENCSASTTDDIIDHLRQSRLRARPLRLNTIVFNLTGRSYSTFVVNFDLSGIGLYELDLRDAQRLERLNLTLNKFHSLSSIRLGDNTTLHSMDVSYNRLSVLRSDQIPSTRRLSLRSNAIMELEANLSLPNALLELDLTRNEIENISLVAFSSSRLTALNLSINLINAISTETFVRLPALEVLQLECNKIVEIEPDTFRGNGRLIELNLRDNNIFTLKKGVFDNLLNLRVLDVSKNRLLRLTPDNVRGLDNLVHFSMSENKKLCREQCKRDLQFLLVLGGHLRVLKVSGIGMQTFPVMLTTSVCTLDLSANKFTRVQTGSLENFPLLQVLDLSGNTIRQAEKDVFSRMEYLRELYLQDNRLERVPGSLPASLRVLRLDGNRIRVISNRDLGTLHRLEELRLNSNSITNIDSDAFRPLSSLRFLEISANPIQQLRVDTFEGVNTLRTLYATGIVTVRVNATEPRYFPISELPSLRYLNLSRSAELARCFLRDYPLLATVKQLEVLDLDETDLAQMPHHLQHFLPRLGLLSLRRNPLNCSDSDRLTGAWTEPHRLETPHHPTGDTDLTVRVTRRSTRPSCGRVTIRSECAFTAHCSIISREDIWSSDNIPLLAFPQVRPRRKLNSRSLADRTIVNATEEWHEHEHEHEHEHDSTPRPTSIKPTTPIRTTPFSIHSIDNDSINGGSSSFFDWFAPFNNKSTTNRSRIADQDGERPDTHAALFIFLFTCTLTLVAAFASFVVPACAHIRVSRCVCRHRTSHSVQPDLPYVEISSISTSIQSEVHFG